MTQSIPINCSGLRPPGPACAVDPVDGPWESLISAREADENFVAESFFERSRAYDAHDRIIVGMDKVPGYHPATVTPDGLQAWIKTIARDDKDAMVLCTALDILLSYAVRLGVRHGDPTPKVRAPRQPRRFSLNAPPKSPAMPLHKRPHARSHRATPPSASDAVAVMEAVFGPRNGWSVVTQGLVCSDWYEGLSPKTQTAFVLRCKNIAVAFHDNQALWPRGIQPEEIVDWIDQQTKNDNVAAGYYVAFSRLLACLDAHDWRLAVLSPPLADLWAERANSAGDDSELA